MLKPLELEWYVFSEDSNDDHTKCLKQELIKWKCITNDTMCIRLANYKLQWYLTDPKRTK